MSTPIPTKRTLIAGMKLSNAVVVHERPTAIFANGTPYKDYNGREWQPVYVKEWRPNPTDHIRISVRGFIAHIFASGRTILDTDYNMCGQCFDGKAKGKTLTQRRANGIKLLHGAIKRSGLRK